MLPLLSNVANINGMAKKYAAKKRMIEQLSNNLAKCDETIASLKDDLHQAKKKKDSVVSTNQGPSMPTLLEIPSVSRVDSSFYPTQEQRPNTASAALEDMSSTDSSTSNSSVTLHIIKASHAIYLQMKVDPCITIQNLTNKIASRLLLSGSYSDDFESCSLFFKEKELINLSRSISDYQMVDNTALVLMPCRSISSLDEKEEEMVQDDATPSETSNVEKDIPPPLQTSNVNVESKLEEILSAIHALQKVSDYRVKGNNAAQKEKCTTDTIRVLNIDSTVAAADDEEDDSDETKYTSDDNDGHDESQPKDEESSVASSEDKEIKVPLLKVDTTGEVHDNKDSFNLPTSIEVTSAQDSSPEVDYLPQKKETKSTSTKEDNDASASTCYSISGSNLDNVDDGSNTNSSAQTNSSHDGYESTEEAIKEERTPTPSTGYLDRSIPLENTTESEQTWGPEAQQFRFSEFDSSEMKDDDSVDEDINETIDYSNEDEVGIPPNTNLKITSGQPAAVDTSMQSIEISFSEFVPNDEVHTEEKKEDEDHDLNGKKKLFGCFDLFRKKQTKKNMIPKWNRSKRIVKKIRDMNKKSINGEEANYQDKEEHTFAYEI